MPEMEVKRNRVSALLNAGMGYAEIARLVPCCQGLIAKVKRLKKEGKSLQRLLGSSGQNKERTLEFMANVSTVSANFPTTSMRALAKDLGVSDSTIRLAVKDLRAFSYICRCHQLLTTASKETRDVKGKKLLNWMKSDGSTVRIFSNKKNWTADQAQNSRNNRFLTFYIDEVPPITSTKHPASAMMLSVIASDRKRMDPYWFPKDLRVGTNKYLKVMKNVVLLGCRLITLWVISNYIWQQDSAPGHKAIKTQKWCQKNLGHFGLEATLASVISRL